MNQSFYYPSSIPEPQTVADPTGTPAQTPAPVVARACSFNSLLLQNGESARGYKSPSVAYGAACEGMDRTCSNGILGGDPAYQYNSCSVGTPPAPTAAGCRPVLKEVRVLSGDRALNCAGRTTIWDENFSATGRAVAKITLQLAGAGNGGVHGWSAQFDKFGDGSRQAYGAGEDLCHNEALTKKYMGLGRFQAGQSGIAVSIGQYRSGACVDGTITVKAGSTMEVWIEDPSPACAGKDIAYASAFGGGTAPKNLSYSLTPMVSASLSLAAAANIRVIAQNEVSPSSTSNACGNRAQYAGGFIQLNGTIVDQQNVGYPASEGMTHALILNEYAGLRAAGTYTATASAAVNQAPQLGALCATPISGDSAIAIIVER